MGILIAYALGILTAITSKQNHKGNRTRTPNHDKPLSVTCVPERLSDEEQAQIEKKNRREENKYKIEKWTLAVLCIYAGFTILLWYAAKDATYQDERPWVSADHWEFPLKIAEGFPNAPCADRNCVGIYIRNVGRTPAMNVRAGAQVTIAPDDSGFIPSPAETHPIRGVLPNDQTAAWFLKRLSSNEITEFAKGKKRMYVRAKIEYCDIWANLNWTELCIYHEPTTPETEFWPCERIKDSVGTTKAWVGMTAGGCEGR